MTATTAYFGFPPSPPSQTGPSGTGYLTVSTGTNALDVTLFVTNNNAISNISTGYVFLNATGTFNVKMVVYNSNGNATPAPTTLVASSNAVSSPTGGYTNVQFTFSSPFSLSANTQYFVGFMTDNGFTCTYVEFPQTGGSSYTNQYTGVFYAYAETYSSGPPANLTGATPVNSGVDAAFQTCLVGTYSSILQGWPEGAPYGSYFQLTNTAVYVSRFVTDSNGLTNSTGYWICEAGYEPGPTSNGLMVIYSDSGGNPSNLIATSQINTGTISNNNAVFTFTSPPTLQPTTTYWAGFFMNWPNPGSSLNYALFWTDGSYSAAVDDTATWPNPNQTFTVSAKGFIYLPIWLSGNQLSTSTTPAGKMFVLYG